jgi:HD-like signal output (HDOD) protein
MAEQEQLGTSHAEIGAYLLGLWGISGVVVDAVGGHHRPEVAEDCGPELDVLAITHIADALAYETVHEGNGEAPEGGRLLNSDYVKRRGLEAELPAWRAMARQVSAELVGG